ncbi:DUF7519 family protein [Haloarcula amylovorans]|uniref:DUF7519 family protein n=1 Tax=Haloarcula amylovorans TaxID=2562280 RepID=UPI0010763780|nr:hypothetical protein [Halomicroarcula amylolytica]
MKIPDSPPDTYPSLVSSILALVTAVSGSFLGAVGTVQMAPLLLAVPGLTISIGGSVLRQAAYRRTGTALAVSGFAWCCMALLGAIALGLPLLTLLPLLATGVGLLMITCNLFPCFCTGRQSLVLFGLAAIFFGVLGNTIIGNLPVWRAATAMSLLFFAWNMASEALSLGNHGGYPSKTTQVELRNAVSSGLTASIAIGMTVGVSRISIARGSVVGLALILVGLLSFVLLLYYLPYTGSS